MFGFESVRLCGEKNVANFPVQWLCSLVFLLCSAGRQHCGTRGFLPVFPSSALRFIQLAPSHRSVPRQPTGLPPLLWIIFSLFLFTALTWNALFQLQKSRLWYQWSWILLCQGLCCYCCCHSWWESRANPWGTFRCGRSSHLLAAATVSPVLEHQPTLVPWLCCFRP